jgi:hypothetical protein
MVDESEERGRERERERREEGKVDFFWTRVSQSSFLHVVETIELRFEILYQQEGYPKYSPIKRCPDCARVSNASFRPLLRSSLPSLVTIRSELDSRYSAGKERKEREKR